MITITIPKNLLFWMIVVWFISTLPDFLLGIAYILTDWNQLMKWLS